MVMLRESDGIKLAANSLLIHACAFDGDNLYGDERRRPGSLSGQVHLPLQNVGVPTAGHHAGDKSDGQNAATADLFSVDDLARLESFEEHCGRRPTLQRWQTSATRRKGTRPQFQKSGSCVRGALAALFIEPVHWSRRHAWPESSYVQLNISA